MPKFAVTILGYSSYSKTYIVEADSADAIREMETTAIMDTGEHLDTKEDIAGDNWVDEVTPF